MVRTECDEVPRHISSTSRRIFLALVTEGSSFSPEDHATGKTRIKIKETVTLKIRDMNAVTPCMLKGEKINNAA